jgi:hypothetical protein
MKPRDTSAALRPEQEGGARRCCIVFNARHLTEQRLDGFEQCK